MLHSKIVYDSVSVIPCISFHVVSLSFFFSFLSHQSLKIKMVCQRTKKKNIERDFDSISTRLLHNRLLKSSSMFKKKEKWKYIEA